jgi:predicted  nucleic acid-binding Zn-ribbon protein
MSFVDGFLELHEIDQLLLQATDEPHAERWASLGLKVESAAALVRDRDTLAATLDRRWLGLYERSLGRYGRGLSLVRQRVCLGCRLTLPTSAAPPPGVTALHLCVGCGRLLIWE